MNTPRVPEPVSYESKMSRSEKLRVLWQVVRRRAAEGHPSVARQLGEMAFLWLRSGVKPPLYLAAGLYRRELSWRDRFAYIGERRYRMYIHQINPLRYHFLMQNKIASKGMISIFGIPVPKFHGYICAEQGSTFDGIPLRTPADLEDLLRRIDAQEVCFKPVDGMQGRGFIRVALGRDADPFVVRVQPEGPQLTVADLWDQHLNAGDDIGYFCEDVIDQHPDVARFNPHSLNTVRVWIYQPEEGVWEVYDAVLRMGVGRVVVDNLSAGGIGPRIDIDTGVLGPAVVRRPDRPIYQEHPATGVRIEGAVVPMWDDVVALCRQIGGIFPYLRLLAIDVALGSEGPFVLEVSAGPQDHQVGFGRGVGPFLKELARGSGSGARREARAGC